MSVCCYGLELILVQLRGFEMDKIEPILRDEFGVDTKTFGVSVMVGFGYRINPQPKMTRQPINDIVEWR